MPLIFDLSLKRTNHLLMVVMFGIFLAACSSSRNVPINDRSTGSVKSDQVSNVSKATPIASSSVTVKSDPVKENKVTAVKNDQKPPVKTEPKSDVKAENKPSEPNKTDASVPDPDFSIVRPATGQVVASYNGGTNKGIDIAGKLGDPVFAGADGKVIFADAFKGYGNTLIIKHDNRFVTVYSHNKTLLVKEGQQVKRGQKVAEMGDSESDKVKLHFEIRRDGKPVDPTGYLQ